MRVDFKLQAHHELINRLPQRPQKLILGVLRSFTSLIRINHPLPPGLILAVNAPHLLIAPSNLLNALQWIEEQINNPYNDGEIFSVAIEDKEGLNTQQVLRIARSIQKCCPRLVRIAEEPQNN